MGIRPHMLEIGQFGGTYETNNFSGPYGHVGIPMGG